MMRWTGALALSILVAGSLGAHAGPLDARRPAESLGGNGALCQPAIQAAEAAAGLPSRLLSSIGMVESGRVDPRSGRVVSWPWTINVAGTGYFFETKAEAIAAVERSRAQGVQSIDVGCMQVNLLHHPAAFASLEQAFDPAANAAYAASFLARLFAQTRAWPNAAAAYHSQTPGVSDTYQRRVMAIWPLAARYGARPDAPVRPSVDPRGVYTPEFRERLMQDAADRDRRIAMGVVPAPRSALREARSARRPLTPASRSAALARPSQYD